MGVLSDLILSVLGGDAPAVAPEPPAPTVRADASMLSSAYIDGGLTTADLAAPGQIRYLLDDQRRALAAVGIGRRIVHGVADLATRHGWTVTEGDRPDVSAGVDADLGVLERVRDADALARQDGVAWLLPVERGVSLDRLAEPRTPGPSRGVVALHALSYREAVPVTWDVTLGSPTMGQPITLQVVIQRDSVSIPVGVVHRSRLVRVPGMVIDPTDRSPDQRPGADLSAIEVYWPAIADYERTAISYARVAQLIATPWMRLPGVQEMSASDRPGLLAAMDTFRRLMGSLGLSLLQPGSEMGILSPSLSGARDLMLSAYERLAAPEGAPPEWLVGARIGGIGSDAAGVRERERMFIEAHQHQSIAPALAELYVILLGPGSRTIEFGPLDTPTEAERATTDLTRSQAAAARIAAGLSSADEERDVFEHLADDDDDGGLDLLTEEDAAEFAAALAAVGQRADDGSHAPPEEVQAAARRALDVREAAPPSRRGMTAVGLARARDLSGGRPVSLETIRRMVAYFDRHEIDKQGETWDDQGPGWQAWHGWGGDAGRAWARRVLRDAEE